MNHVTLADHTTLRVGGPAAAYVEATTEAELIEQVSRADAAGTPVLVLGGGSNVVIGPDGFDGLVVKVATRGIDNDSSACAGAMVTVAAGENWDDFVGHAVEQEWVGVETLSGIPGLAGATPIQNVGAYGSDVSQTIARVKTYDRQTGEQKTFFAADCGFSYRDSIFKANPGRYLVLSVTFQFKLGNLSAPVAYAELARTLGVQQGERAPLAEVREAVLKLRAGKGMVLDADDHDTWSAGSFFTNPIVDLDTAAALPEGAPRFPAADSDDRVKTSAAWLIDHAGFAKGFTTPELAGRVSLSTKHTLALTNRGSGTADDVLALAGVIRDGVAEKFGITLVPEPVMVNCRL